MKHVTYTFTEADIEACLFALTKLYLLHDDDEITDAQIQINEQCALSAAEKLACGNQLTANELRVLCCCITCCNLVCQKVFSADDTTYKECMKYFFSLNKLDNELSSQIM